MRKIIVAAVMALLVSGCAKTEKNVPLPLSEEEIDRALVYGRQNSELTMDEFVKDWTLDCGYEQGKGRAMLVTPFLRTALLGQQAVKMGQEPDRKLVEAALREDAGLIRFRVMIYGDEPDFSKNLKFQLKCGSELRDTVYKNLPPYSDFSRDYFNIASGDVKFSGEAISRDAKVSLVVINTDPKSKTKSCEFFFDLSKYQ